MVKLDQSTGINVELSENKYLDLIKLSDTTVNFVTNLRKRIKKVAIVNEGDLIKITSKYWIDKHTWQEINDILKLCEFT